MAAVRAGFSVLALLSAALVLLLGCATGRPLTSFAREDRAFAWSPWATNNALAVRLGVHVAEADNNMNLCLAVEAWNMGERPLAVPRKMLEHSFFGLVVVSDKDGQEVEPFQFPYVSAGLFDMHAFVRLQRRQAWRTEATVCVKKDREGILVLTCPHHVTYRVPCGLVGFSFRCCISRAARGGGVGDASRLSEDEWVRLRDQLWIGALQTGVVEQRLGCEAH